MKMKKKSFFDVVGTLFFVLQNTRWAQVYYVYIFQIENRTVRVGLMNLFFGASWPIGAALSGVLFQKLGFYGVYYISTSLYVLAFVYGFIRIKERLNTRVPDESAQNANGSCMHAIADFFNVKHITDAFRVTFKKTSRKRWIRLYILLFTVVVVQGPMQGEQKMIFECFSPRSEWTVWRLIYDRKPFNSKRVAFDDYFVDSHNDIGICVTKYGFDSLSL